MASGDPVMCAIIFAAKVFKDEWRTGVDPFAEWIGEPVVTERCTLLDRAAFLKENTYLAFVATLKVAP